MKRMKQFFIVVLSIPLFVLLFIGGSDGDLYKRAYLWSRGGRNMVTSIEDKDSSNNRTFPSFVMNSDSEDEITDYTFKNPGEEGYGLNIMYLLQSLNPNSQQALKYKELIELYYKASSGELDTAQYHLTPESYAAMHRNETGDATFLDDCYGKEIGPYSSEDMTLSRFTGNMLRKIGITGTGGVFKDANGDGLPDGSFQIERGEGVDSNKKSTMNGKDHIADRAFDVIYFPDQLSWINHNFSDSIKQYDLEAISLEELSMLASVIHNRGSISRQAFGIPYNTKGLEPVNQYINVDYNAIYKESCVLFQDLLNQFRKERIIIRGTDNTSQNALAVFLALKAGWYIDSDVGNLKKVVNSETGIFYFQQIFPEAGDVLPSVFLEKFYVKKPWEVAGISKIEYGRIYGMRKDKYSDYYPYTFLFKVEEYTSLSYLNKLPDGTDPKVIHAWDYLPLGHCVASSILGDYILLDMFVKAGLPDTVDTVKFDPTNPTIFYETLKKKNPDSYSPMKVKENIKEDFSALISMLNVETTDGRLQSLYYTYENLGTKYWFGGGGLEIDVDNYKEHLKYVSANSIDGISGINMLNAYFYKTISGTAYQDGITKNDNLYFKGSRLFDCAKLVLCGPSLGETKGRYMYYNYNSSGILAAANKGKNDELRQVNGKMYDTGLYIASNGAHTVAEYKDDPSLVNGGLQPGDILVRNGHAFTFLCIAPENIILPAAIARNGSDVAIAKNSMVTLEAWKTGEYNRVRDRGWRDQEKYFVVRVYMFDI